MMRFFIALSIFIFTITATTVIIGGSRNTYEQEISDKAQLEYCKNLQEKSTKKKERKIYISRKQKSTDKKQQGT